jgi:hypothetical protein
VGFRKIYDEIGMIILQALLGSLFLLQKFSFYHFNLKTVVRGSPETLGRQCFCSSCKKCCPFFCLLSPPPIVVVFRHLPRFIFMKKLLCLRLILKPICCGAIFSNQFVQGGGHIPFLEILLTCGASHLLSGWG